jgi:predicted transcriptional regulator
MRNEDLEALFDRVRTWPAEKQEEALAALQWLEGCEDVYELSPEEDADLDEALAEMDRGEVATPEEVAAVFGRKIGVKA